MITKKNDFPLSIRISFSKLFEKYEANLSSKNELVQQRAKRVLDIAKAYPKLSEGFLNEKEVLKNQSQIDLVLEDLFSSVLQENEIKVASIPYQYFIFKSSQRYRNLTAAAGKDFQLKFTDFDTDQAYIMGCSMILNTYYGYRVDFRRPFYYQIPDAQGIIRHYKVLYNADFVEILKTKNSIEITQDDVAELLENFNNIEIWKQKFPPESWIFKGFVIANMYDATIDVALSNFKANLLKDHTKDENFVDDFQSILHAIFNLPELKVGYTLFNEEDEVLEAIPQLYNSQSFILNGKTSVACDGALCDRSYESLFNKHEFYCITDVNKYHALYPNNILYKNLYKQKIQSAIIASIVAEGKVLGILEIVSPHANELNTINANKLLDIMPYLVDSVKRSKEQEENEIELLIQSECTSIHPSVHWKFKKEAERVIREQLQGNQVAFREIVFENVYPLYGQIDIKGSSEARNLATQKDLILQLKHVQKIIRKIYKIDTLPIYEQIDFNIKNYLNDVDDHLNVDSERLVLNFLQKEIVPLYEHLKSKSPALESLINEYYEIIDDDKGFIYKHRKDYDDSVMLINKKMATILDQKQVEAQLMYPHYFERFKTDGVEHNLYIGESITKKNNFNKIYLYNLRLWQLQAMCEMENSFYRLKEQLPIPLNVSSMILAFHASLSLRFRMDEKRFDVDGTYNARYEVVKKRVDKARVKGSTDRITQPGKITIIYSQKEDEKEYLKYIRFLQAKKQLVDDIEIVKVEDLQGVTGLKAIRVSVLYSKEQAGNEKEYYTYEDLMKELDT
ncbi:MAG: GAF domain-containing protein [Altibacter sp.]|uniref:GAF domain-containing protein n=1 Tax=Altibacter sp. TaxID=2024823 RepID=UPI001D29045D|nr:GAF domain-containing protein [Altibacter sp.]MBZ0326137.1 GAF domain-containing protein [Altibacter sp.]